MTPIARIRAIQQQKKNITEDSLLHQIGLFWLQFHTWPAAVTVALMLTLCGCSAAAWWLAGGRPFPAALAFALFVLGDGLLLAALPRWRISFGPWEPPLVQLALLRLVGALLAAGVAALVSAVAGFAFLLVSQTCGSLMLLYGVVIEPHRLQLTTLEIGLPQWPASAPPVRILHVADLHIERPTRREAAVVGLAQKAAADLIVISGDYPNVSYVSDPETHQHIRNVLRQLSAPHGVFATLGTPPVDVREEIAPLFADLPVRLLRDEWATVDLGDGRALAILGMDCTHEIPEDTAVLDHLLPHAPAALPILFLYHSPELMPQAVERKIDLYLCGHTHGGQVRLPLYGGLITSSQLKKRYEMGHYYEGQTHLYISRGIGLEGMSAPRIRFLCPPEMTLVTLRGAG